MTVAFLRSNVKSMKHKLLKLSGSFTVGRAKVQEVSLCLLDVNISRKHCEFRFNPIEKNWTVTDSSSNGVTVNGKRCQKSVEFSLADGDQIILAEQKHLYSWTFQVPLTPLSMAATRTRNVEVMDEDEQEVAEGEKQEEAGAGAEEAQEDEDRANLDKVVANHSSEDNKSFIELQVENEKNGAKNAWMYKDEAMYLEMKAQQMALPSMEQQAALPYKPGNVDTWTYQNINSVFHNPDGLELTEAEKIEKAKKEKIIIHNNTRISKTPWKSDKQVDKLRKEVEQREALAAGKVGIDGKDLVRPETPSVNGFKLMSMTPSPALGVADSPLMTWGQAETTPYMLGGCDTPLVTSGGGQGQGFQIRDLSDRDKIALQLADNNSKYYRERKTKAMEQVRSSLKAGKGLAGGLSPAAQRLASGKLGIRLGTVVFACFIVIGQVIFALGGFVDTLWIMEIGRFIFGIGGESLAVAQNTYAVAW